MHHAADLQRLPPGSSSHHYLFWSTSRERGDMKSLLRGNNVIRLHETREWEVWEKWGSVMYEIFQRNECLLREKVYQMLGSWFYVQPGSFSDPA